MNIRIRAFNLKHKGHRLEKKYDPYEQPELYRNQVGRLYYDYRQYILNSSVPENTTVEFGRQVYNHFDALGSRSNYIIRPTPREKDRNNARAALQASRAFADSLPPH